MEEIVHFRLSLHSLLVFSFIPFLYFVILVSRWRTIRAARNAVIFLQGVSILLCIGLLVRMIMAPRAAIETLELEIAHFLPLVLTILIVNQGRLLARYSGTSDDTISDTNETSYKPEPLNTRIEQIGWDDLVINLELKEDLIGIIKLLAQPQEAKNYGIEIPRGILLTGPPGTGKTSIAKVISKSANLAFFAIQSDEIFSRLWGDAEKKLSALFKAAAKHAPSVIFIDEVDAIGRPRSDGGGGQNYVENLLNHLLQLIDGVVKLNGVYIIGATNRPDLVDPALKRGGRLSRIIEIPLPNFEARCKLFALYLGRLNVPHSLDLNLFAKLTSGKSAADIKEVCNQAGLNAFKRESGSPSRNYAVTVGDIEKAMRDLL